MIIGGIQKFSLVDYPGKTSAAVFTVGCNMRCGYCHNPELVLPEQYAPAMPLADIMQFLESRRGKLDAVVVSGGEPTMHEDLPELLAQIKKLGFLVKLDSNGTHPDMLEQIIASKTVDFVAMDIKGPLEKYQAIAARAIDLTAIQRSIQLILKSGVDHEFRTTVVKCLLPPEDFPAIGKLVRGARRFAIQRFRPTKVISPVFLSKTTYDDDELHRLKQIMERYVDECVIH